MPDLSTPSSRLLFVTPHAQKYGLEPEIVCAVCEQESSWNPWAIRYEQAFYDTYVIPLKLGSLTEARMRATSFGLMQVLGEVAREFGFGGGYLTQLCDPDTGVNYGCRKLQKCFDVHGTPDCSLLAYNGGGNKDYAAEVLARISHYTNLGGSQ